MQPLTPKARSASSVTFPVARPVVQPVPQDTTPGEVQTEQPPQLIPPVVAAPEQIAPGAIPDLPSADLLAPARPR